MIERKPDAARIEAHLDALRQLPWIGAARQWWPKYVFFIAELQNALRILQAGRLACRSQRQMAVDTGSEEVLDQTDEQWKDYVRLYFRPRTPTQHQIEGFRPAGSLGSLGKHMPVPVVFLFDAKDILTRKTTQFSNGNLAAHPIPGDDADYFEAIPFQKVYHDSPMAEAEKANIKFHRCAEVIIPQELKLDALKFVYCRSEAEHLTLRNLLPAATLRKYGGLFRQGRRPNLHFCKWSFAETATLEQKKISLTFNASTLTPGAFVARLEVLNRTTGERYHWDRADFRAKEPLTVGVPQLVKPTAYAARFTLNGAIAYAGQFTPKTIPF